MTWRPHDPGNLGQLTNPSIAAPPTPPPKPKFVLPAHLVVDPDAKQAAQPVAPPTVQQPQRLPPNADAAVAAVGTAPAPIVGASASSATAPKPLSPPSLPKAAQGREAIRRHVRSQIDGLLISRKHGKAYARVTSKGYIEIFAIGSGELNGRIRAWARALGYALKQRDLDDLNEELRSEAEDAGIHEDMYPRVRPLANGGVEIDLNDGKGTTVRLAHGKVEIVSSSSTGNFLRAATALALPIPADQGEWRFLRRYLNVSEDAALLAVAWIAFIINSPKVEATKYVFLVIKGTQGTGKTFASKVIQRLIDPNAVSAQSLPSSVRDLAIMLQAVHLLVVDNMRDLTTALSDALCIASTGGSVPMRRLYTDDEQKALPLHGAIGFNGIHPFMGQSDFADRCLVLELDPIEPGRRQSEAQMLAQFEIDQPIILRGLYDLVVKAQQFLPDAEVVAPTRMLDFTRWLAAMEMALELPRGKLQHLYANSLAEAQLDTLLDNPLAATIMEFATGMEGDLWEGTPAELYDRLGRMSEFGSQHSRAWPSSAAVLGKRLHGLQAPLLAQGVSLSWTRGKDRLITVRKVGQAKGQGGDTNAAPPPQANSGTDSLPDY